MIAGLMVACAACVSATAPANVSFKTYGVSGDSVGALNRELALHGPEIPGQGRALASSDITFVPDVRLKQNGNGCRVVRSRFQVDAEVTLPEWRQRDRASPDLAAVWTMFSDEALQHELVHVRIAEEHAREMERAVRGRTAASCDELERELRERVARIAEAHSAAQDRFDDEEKQRFANLVRSGRPSP